MSSYIRILDNKRNTLIGFKEFRCYKTSISDKENYIKIASEYTKQEVESRLNNLKEYPVYIQVVKKHKYKNGNITKKVIFEKIII